MCSKCDKHFHYIRGTGYGSKVLYPNCKIDINIIRHHSRAMDSQLMQTKLWKPGAKEKPPKNKGYQKLVKQISKYHRGVWRQNVGYFANLHIVLSWQQPLQYNCTCPLNINANSYVGSNIRPHKDKWYMFMSVNK